LNAQVVTKAPAGTGGELNARKNLLLAGPLSCVLPLRLVGYIFARFVCTIRENKKAVSVKAADIAISCLLGGDVDAAGGAVRTERDSPTRSITMDDAPPARE
jgi:hypothetical protein